MAWILIVEDDRIFSTLFVRAWKVAHPNIPALVVENLKAMADLLGKSESPPLLVVMDRTLPDGDGHEAAASLDCQVHLWSATDDPGAESKPRGKAGLEEAVRRLAELAGLG